MKNRTTKTLLILLLVAVLAATGVYAAVRYGTQDDPLVTMSYLTDVKEPELADAYSVKADAAVEEMKNNLPASDTAAVTGDYVSAELTAGQTLKCEAGTEVLLRSGKVTASAVLTDVTDGAQVEAGKALTANHLYIAPAAGITLQTDGSAALMLRGGYSIG